MTVFGLTITRTKQIPAGLSSPDSRGGWWPVIRESFAGAWQRNIEVSVPDVLSYSAVWSCVTLIAGDISKLWLRLMEQKATGIWAETENSAYSPVLRKPNHYQNRIQFLYCWLLSKLIHGNTYVLKMRDARGVVNALYVLDPTRVRPLVAPDSSVYYQLNSDRLSRVFRDEDLPVPASEIIHDIMVPLYHPLVGVSPIHACGLAAMQGLKIQENSTKFFSNNSQPGGVLTAPGLISKETADRIRTHWENQFAGPDNVGRVAVLGDGLKYEAMSVNAHDAQLIEQLKWTAETVCSCYHVPPYMIGVGPMPSYNNVQALNLQYYSQALQHLIESIELCLDEGLSVKPPMGVELDISALLRMDTATQMDMAVKGVGAAIYTPNEGRAEFDKPPIAGGDSAYLQVQNYSLSALAKRDASADPFATQTERRGSASSRPVADDDDDDDLDDDIEANAAALGTLLRKELAA